MRIYSKRSEEEGKKEMKTYQTYIESDGETVEGAQLYHVLDWENGENAAQASAMDWWDSGGYENGISTTVVVSVVGDGVTKKYKCYFEESVSAYAGEVEE
jgi:hypothetical protein